MAALAALPAAVMAFVSWSWVPSDGEWNPRLYAVTIHNEGLRGLRERLLQDLVRRSTVVKTERIAGAARISTGDHPLPPNAFSTETVYPVSAYPQAPEMTREESLKLLNSLGEQ